MQTPRRLSDELARIADQCKGRQLTFRELSAMVEERGDSMLALLLSLPFLMPVPLPGYSIAIGLYFILLGTREALGYPLWLPKWIANRSVSSAALVKVFSSTSRLFRRFEKVIKPRGKWAVDNPAVQTARGILIAICGFLLCLPLPPGTNSPPGTCIILLCIGALENDAVFHVLGYIAFVLNLVFFGALLFFGVHGVQWLSKYSEFMK